MQMNRRTNMESQPAQGRSGRFISLRFKLLLGFTLIFTLVFAVAFFWFYQYSRKVAMDLIATDMVTTAEAAAEKIDGDVLVELFQEAQTNEEGFSDDPRWIAHLDYLDSIHHIEPRAWLYTYIEGDPALLSDAERAEYEALLAEGERAQPLIFIGDLYSRYNVEKAGRFRENYISTGGMYDGLFETTYDLEPFDDGFGVFVSAWVPVTNSAGENVGGLGVDFEASYVREVQNEILSRVMIAFAVAYGSLFLLVYLVSNALTRPIMSLTRAAEQIGEGNYDQNLAGLTKDKMPDEIDTLAQVFSIMVDKVSQREKTLRKQVEELRIMVDEQKKRAQVEEIVESDFFRDLQDKAREMRRRSEARRQQQDN
jgi:HAMP domain-containing protein